MEATTQLPTERSVNTSICRDSLQIVLFVVEAQLKIERLADW
ncbi:hypothetical protein [Pelagihabitans pacificus]|nr:hypothetical protein [Pelagihabitans pacificus]